MHWLVASGLITILILSGLRIWCRLDQRAEYSAWRRLISYQPPNSETFSLEMVADLPEPVRRYFTFSINEGTPICRAVQIEMTGDLSIGTKEIPNSRSMVARQILAPPFGFIWKLSSKGITGTDGLVDDLSWTRFWLFSILPIVRAKGEDHRRSAFGRMIGESALWSPASLLPGPNVSWVAVDSNHVRATVNHGGLEQSIDMQINDEGKPCRLHFQRWSNVNPENKYRHQSFGGDLCGYKSFHGYQLPTKVSAGNHYGTADYYPFFQVIVTKINFPGR